MFSLSFFVVICVIVFFVVVHVAMYPEIVLVTIVTVSISIFVNVKILRVCVIVENVVQAYPMHKYPMHKFMDIESDAQAAPS